MEEEGKAGIGIGMRRLQKLLDCDAKEEMKGFKGRSKGSKRLKFRGEEKGGEIGRKEVGKVMELRGGPSRRTEPCPTLATIFCGFLISCQAECLFL